MEKIRNTIQKAGNYHANIKIPAVLRASYGGQEHWRRSLKTSDPRTAEMRVNIIRATMQAEREAAERKADLDRLTAALAPDQLKLFKDAGGLGGLLARYEASKDAPRFMEAAYPTRHEGDDSDTRCDEELVIEQASHRAITATMQAQANNVAKTLRALGEDAEIVGDAHSLRDIVEDWSESVDPQTAETARTITRRFTEFHGEIGLAELEGRHLREFVDAAKGLPKVQSGKRRKMSFNQLIEDAKRRKSPTIGYATQRKIFDMLRGLLSHAQGRGFIDSNPWAGLKLKAPKKKHSATPPRRPFTPQELRKILDHVRESNDPQFGPDTLDRWGPWIGTYHGLRIQEVSQLRVTDFAERDGVWSMQITDAGEGQRAKSQASVRWVPVHPAIGDLRGLVDARRRGVGGDAFLFQYWHRYRKRVMDLKPDGRGRVSGAYGKRFASLLDRLDLSDPEIVFHSFRHRLQDAADNVGIPDSHRRYLTGRANKDAVEGGYGAGASMSALLPSLAAIDPLS